MSRGSEVRGQRAAKGEERAGGGWRIVIFGCRAAEAGTRVRRVRRVRRKEESGGGSKHAQPGNGSGEWLRQDVRLSLLSSSQIRASSPAASAPSRKVRESPYADRGGAGPPAIPSRPLTWPGARPLAFFSGAEAWSRAPRRLSRPFIDCFALGGSFWTPVVCAGRRRG